MWVGPEVEKIEILHCLSILEKCKGFLEVHGHVNIDLFMYAHAIEIDMVTLLALL